MSYIRNVTPVQKDPKMDSITIQGHDFTVAPRYSAGHVLTENEASTLNQTLFENLRNNFAKQVKDAKGEGELSADALADLQSKLDAYAATYLFGVRSASGPRAPADPVGKEAFTIAKDAVKNAIRAKGFKPSDYSAEQIGDLAKQALEKNRDRFYALANQRIAERAAIASDILGDAAPAPEASPEPAPKKSRKAAATEAA